MFELNLFSLMFNFSKLNLFSLIFSLICTLMIGFKLSNIFRFYHNEFVKLCWITAILFGFLIYYTTNWLFEKASLLLGF